MARKHTPGCLCCGTPSGCEITECPGVNPGATLTASLTSDAAGTIPATGLFTASSCTLNWDAVHNWWDGCLTGTTTSFTARNPDCTNPTPHRAWTIHIRVNCSGSVTVPWTSVSCICGGGVLTQFPFPAISDCTTATNATFVPSLVSVTCSPLRIVYHVGATGCFRSGPFWDFNPYIQITP